MALAPGTRLGPYRLLDLLGEGGMGAVYRARDERLGRDVAIKVLASQHAREEDFARFRREARAIAALSHRNVLALHEASLDRSDGAKRAEERPYLVLELATGGSLAGRLRRSGPLPWREVAHIGAGLASGLAAAHEAGLIHRDLKPANVLFGADGTPKLADFGLVRAEGTLAQSRRLTATGELLGTPEFMSPEQLDEVGNLTPASDVFSLGSTLFAALAGRPPFEGRGPALLFQVLAGAPAPLGKLAPDTPPALLALISRLLEKDPAKRLTARQVAGELDVIARGRAADSNGKNGPGARRVAGTLVGVGAVVGVLAGVGLAVSRTRPPEPATPVTPTPTGVASPTSRASPLRPGTPTPGTVASPELPPTSLAEIPTWAVPLAKSRGGRFRLTCVLGGDAGADDDDVRGIGFLPDGNGWAVDAAGLVRLWRVADGQELRRFHAREPVWGAALAPDGKRLVLGRHLGGATGELDVLDLSSGQASPVHGAGDARPSKIAFAGSSRFVVVNDGGHVFRGELEKSDVRPLVALGLEVTAVAATLAGEVALGTAGGDVFRLHWVDESLPAEPSSRGHGSVVALAFTRDARELAIVRESARDLIVVGAGTASRSLPLATPATVKTHVVFREDGLLVHEDEGAVSVAPPGARELVSRAARSWPGDIWWTLLALSPDGQRAAVATNKSFVVTGLEAESAVASVSSWATPAHWGGVTALAVGPKDTLASGGADGRVTLWNGRTGVPLRQLLGHDGWKGALTSVALSPDGNWIGTADLEGQLRIESLVAARGADPWQMHEGPHLNALAFSPDSKSIALGTDSYLRVTPWFGLESLGAVAELPRVNDVRSLWWPRRDAIVAATATPRVHVWDPWNESHETQTRGPEEASNRAPFRALAVAEKTVVAAGDNGEVWAWTSNFSGVRDHQLQQDERIVARLEAKVVGVGLLQNAALAVAATEKGKIALVDLGSDPPAVIDELELGGTGGEARSLVADGAGRAFFVGTRRGVILRYEVAK